MWIFVKFVYFKAKINWMVSPAFKPHSSGVLSSGKIFPLNTSLDVMESGLPLRISKVGVKVLLKISHKVKYVDQERAQLFVEPTS